MAPFLMHERWLPSLSDWDTCEDWQKSGAKDIAVRANKKYKEILEEAPESLIEPEVDKALADYIKTCNLKFFAK